MPRPLLFATQNVHKWREARALIGKQLRKLNWKMISLRELGLPQARESGKTLEQNARLKSADAARRSGCWTVAEDTGLFVRGLGGAPGVFSARLAGPRATYADNCRKLLRLLAGRRGKERQAEFRAVLCLCSPSGKTWTIEGRLRGKIAEMARGKKGFGYDPIFIPERSRKTLAELSLARKNLISHRARAFRRLVGRLASAAKKE